MMEDNFENDKPENVIEVDFKKAIEDRNREEIINRIINSADKLDW